MVATADLFGAVEDNRGEVLAGAVVTITNIETSVSRAVTSNQDGQYRFDQLAPGVYTLKAELGGYQPVEIKDVDLTLGRDASLDITMQPILSE